VGRNKRGPRNRIDERMVMGMGKCKECEYGDLIEEEWPCNTCCDHDKFKPKEIKSPEPI